jgi:hypothetical protein
MKDSKTRGEETQPTEGFAKRKKPYLKPEFRYERVFEMQALACLKTPTQGVCGFSKKNS